MPAEPFPELVQITLVWDQGGKRLTNVLHARPEVLPGSPLTVAQVADLVEKMRAEWEFHMLPVMSQDITLSLASGREMIPAGAVFDSVSGDPGTRAEAAEPSGVALVLSWKTGFAGPGARCRSFTAGVDENNTEPDGELLPAYLAAVQAAADALVVDLSTTNARGDALEFVCPSFWEADGLGGVQPRVPPVARQIIQVVARRYVKSQRRRNTRG